MDWHIPFWWTLERFPNDTYTLTRVDGITLSSFKTQMGLWGWCISKGEEHFTGLYGEESVMPTVVEAPFAYPDPTLSLEKLDQHYEVV